MRFGYEVFHPDIRAVADFYVAALGFTLREDGDDYLTLTRDGLTVGCSRADDATGAQRRPPHGSEVVLRVDDVRAELRRVEAAGWQLADALQERPWGMTDFRVFDPTGQYVRVTGP